MANYYCHARTNYFKVTDKEKLKELVEKIPGAELWENFHAGITDENPNPKPEDGIWTFAIANDECIDQYEDEDGNLQSIDFILKTILPPGEVVIIIEAGHEKLYTVTGWGMVITNKESRYIRLRDILVEKARELLGNPTYDCSDI